MRYFDAARSYGKAEAFLASWLANRGLGPDDVTVGSKWGYTYTAGWQISAEVPEVKDLSISTLLRQYPQSRSLPLLRDRRPHVGDWGDPSCLRVGTVVRTPGSDDTAFA